MCPVYVGRKKIFGVKATGSNSFHRCGGPPPSMREVFGVENRRFESCRRARDARPYNVAGNCNCEMYMQRWVASLQRLDVFATVGCTAVPRRSAHCALVRPRRYNSNFSRGRAKGHRGDRKAPISNRRQGRKALTGEAPRPPSSREGDRRSGGRSERRSARPRGLGGLEPCARCAGKSMAEIGNRKERLRDYASFPEDFDLPRSKVATGLLPFAWDAPPR